ncbi:MAG: hypothetical protein P8K10_01745, partial [Crocinitomicaceae bacterium]|nr:hypothetical protein [Crocinitomicaceae bacterium]
LIVAPILMFGCKENSALSDVELSDPKLISPEITITKTLNQRGREQTELVVFLNDKNNNSIDLLKGGVKLNNEKLGIQTEWGGAPYYTLNNLELYANTNYSFVVTLANDNSYKCSVASPNGLINSFVVPEYHNINSDLNVSWEKLNSSAYTSYSLEITNEDTFSKEINLSRSIIKNGGYVISSSLLKQISDGQRGDFIITLKASTKGKVDHRFDGGTIKIIQLVNRQVTLDLGEADAGVFTHEDTEEYQNNNKQKHKKENAGFGWLKLVLTGIGGGLLGFLLFYFISNRKNKSQ